MRRLPPLASVRAFEAAARTENFTAAAAELGMTQAAVSYQVKSLEERLGAPLFVREQGRVRLTPLGARLLPALSSAFDAIETAFASHREEDESLLTDHHHAYLRQYLARVAAGRVPDRPPDLAVRMTTSNELVDLRSATPMSRSAPGAATGKGSSNTSCSSRVSPRWRARSASQPRRRARPQA